MTTFAFLYVSYLLYGITVLVVAGSDVPMFAGREQDQEQF